MAWPCWMMLWEKEGLVDAVELCWEQGHWGNLVTAASWCLQALCRSLRCSRMVQLRLVLVLGGRCGSGQGLGRGSVPVLGFWHWLSWPWQSTGVWLVPGQTSGS